MWSLGCSYNNMCDSMRLTYRRIIDVPAPVVARAEQGLNCAVLNTLSHETRLLEKIAKETEIRHTRVSWLMDLSKNWTFQEHSRWRDCVPVLPPWVKRTGQKLTYSKVRKPIKFQRKRIKLAGKEGFTVSLVAEKPTLPPVCVFFMKFLLLVLPLW